jgi:hypothetical protein
LTTLSQNGVTFLTISINFVDFDSHLGHISGIKSLPSIKVGVEKFDLEIIFGASKG